MRKHGQTWKGKIATAGLFMGGMLTLSTTSAFAQLTPDNTLGADSSRVTPLNPSQDRIDGGAIRGSNLFHSFTEFNIGEGRTVSFLNVDGIQNIITRVTGTNPLNLSQINGILEVGGAANFILINPNGINFGKNATLKMGGSFLASTANSVVFNDGIEYSAINPQSPPLLTMSVPVGLQFGANPGNIINQSQSSGTEGMANSIGAPVGLMVPENQTLALVGGDVTLQGGNLSAFGGRIEIGSVKDGGFVSIKPDVQGWQLGYDKVQSFGNIQVVDISDINPNGSPASIASVVDTSGYFFILPSDPKSQPKQQFANNGQGGSIQVRGASLTVQNSGITSSNVGLEGTIGGSVTVNTSKSVEISGTVGELPAGIFAQTQDAGKGGDLSITTNRLIVSNGAQVSTNTYSSGNAGTLTVNATESVELNNAGLFAQVEPTQNPDMQLVSSTGKGGDLTINTPKLTLLNGAQIGASTFSQGDAGSIKINGTEVLLNGEQIVFQNGETRIISSGIYSQSNPSDPQSATGAGGNVTIDAKRLIVENGAQVSVTTSSAKNSGNLTINNAELVQISGQTSDGKPSRLIAETQERGNAGELTINSRQLFIENGATVTVSGQRPQEFPPDFPIGNAGTLTINASDIRLLNGSILGQTVSGQGGNITINTDTIVGLNNGDISAIAGEPNSNFIGKGGVINLTYKGLFGLAERTRQEVLQNGIFDVRQLNSNDIAAYSVTDPTLNGKIIFNTPDIDPTQGAIKTPEKPSPIPQIARGCQAKQEPNSSSFINTGLGGLPPNPNTPFSGVALWQDPASPAPENNLSNRTQTTYFPQSNPNQIIEAQGFKWVDSSKTKVRLTANSSTVTPYSSWQTPASCYGN